jgi:hypothetical protein
MKRASLTGRLYLNEQHVGDVRIRGWEGAWGLGEFEAAPAFAPFAGAFERWSQLMHGKESAGALTPAASDQLRDIERELYSFRAKMFLPDMDQWRAIGIVTIDGRLIEWKETWSGDRAGEQKAK